MRWLLVPLLALAACADSGGSAPAAPLDPAPSSSAGVPEAEADTIEGTANLVYVPAYSHVYSGDRQRPVDLTATLSVRNADTRVPIRLVRVRYVGTDGNRLRSYLDAPRTLGPLATAEFVVDESDRAGGTGASFLVEWEADGPVTEPVVEAVMISTAGQQGISFVTEGRPVRR